MERENAWKKYSEEQVAELEEVSAAYRKFLDKGKTERECVKEIVKLAQKAGYKDIEKIISKDKKLKAGFSSCAGKFVKYHSSAEICRIFLFKTSCKQRIKCCTYIG